MSADQPFDQEQPDDLWREFDTIEQLVARKQPVVEYKERGVHVNALDVFRMDDADAAVEHDPRPEDERTPDLGPMRVAAAAAFISAGVAVVGAWHGFLWLLDVAVS